MDFGIFNLMKSREAERPSTAWQSGAHTEGLLKRVP